MEKYELRKKQLTEKGAKHDNVVVLSLVLEASIEASFQAFHFIHKTFFYITR